MGDRFQFKRATAANWTSFNPVLSAGEPGAELDTGLMKIGDGTSTWTALPYAGSQAEYDTAANLIAADDVLLAGAVAYESDTGKFKIGNGTDSYTSLSYFYQPSYYDTKANLESDDPTLGSGVVAYESDTNAFKVGDGATAYTSLPYFHINYENSQRVGTISFTASLLPDAGCVWTDYRELSQSVYSELFAKIGHTFAKDSTDATAAESAGTFHVPDGAYLRFARGARTYLITDADINTSTDIITVTHGLATDGTADGRAIKLVRRPGESPTYPTGPTEYDQYYLAVQSSSTIRLYTTEADAVTDDGATNLVNFTAAGSGTFYLTTMGTYQDDALHGHRHASGLAALNATNGRYDAYDTGISGEYKDYDAATSTVTYGAITTDPITDGNNGTPRTTNETRPSYVGLGMQIKVVGTATTGETYDTLKYDTGWVANSDWTNAELTVTHNLGADLSDLMIKFMISSDGTDANGIEIGLYSENDAAATTRGQEARPVSSSAFKIQTAAGGIRYLDDSGVGQALGGASAFYYKVVVYKPDLFTKVKENVDQYWSDLSSSGVVNYTLPSDADVDKVVLRYAGGDNTSNYVQLAAGTTINGIASDDFILNNGQLILYSAGSGNGFYTHGDYIFDTYDVTYDSIDYPQDKYTNGKIVRRISWYESSFAEGSQYNLIDALIPAVGDVLAGYANYGGGWTSYFERTASDTITGYRAAAVGTPSSATYKSDGSGTAVTVDTVGYMETKNTVWTS